MKVVKSLNNNMVLVEDNRGKTRICQGKGIGFQKRAGDQVDESLIERTFVPETEDESSHFQQLFSEIPDEYWKLAEDVVKYARDKYSIQVSQRIILPLCDHLAGSVERYRRGVALENPMLWDIKRVYPKEYKVGQYALGLIKKQFHLIMKEDEAAFLAYHFVNAQLDSTEHTASPDVMTEMIGTIIDMVQQSFQIELNEEEWNYQRFLTHLKFFANRILERKPYEEAEDQELFEELKERYPHVYRCVERIADYILIDFHFDIRQEERMYLMIHIERVTRKYLKKQR